MTFTAPIAPGLYRFLVCDGITDGSNALDGDDDGNPGGIATVDFRADPFNEFINGHFDNCPPTLDPWVVSETPPNDVTLGATGADDVDGSPLSTSALYDHQAATASGLAQCVVATGGLDRLRPPQVVNSCQDFIPDRDTRTQELGARSACSRIGARCWVRIRPHGGCHVCDATGD